MRSLFLYAKKLTHDHKLTRNACKNWICPEKITFLTFTEIQISHISLRKDALIDKNMQQCNPVQENLGNFPTRKGSSVLLTMKVLSNISVFS